MEFGDESGRNIWGSGIGRRERGEPWDNFTLYGGRGRDDDLVLDRQFWRGFFSRLAALWSG
jgi:hypothetical protein